MFQRQRLLLYITNTIVDVLHPFKLVIVLLVVRLKCGVVFYDNFMKYSCWVNCCLNQWFPSCGLSTNVPSKVLTILRKFQPVCKYILKKKYAQISTSRIDRI